VVPGRRVEVVEVDEVAKTLKVSSDGREATLSHETAAKIWAEPQG